MKYRFNDHILFDADTRTLSPTDFSDDPISISSPSKRLLLLLIAHHGEAVGRELIFKKVWDDYGMVSSNNNLNQCVSKLRRVIKNLGVEDEVIVTVPKVGFMLRDEITIESYEDAEDIHDAEPAAAVPGSAPAAAANPASDTVIGGASSHLGYSRRGWLMFSAMVLGDPHGYCCHGLFQRLGSPAGELPESQATVRFSCRCLMPRRRSTPA